MASDVHGKITINTAHWTIYESFDILLANGTIRHCLKTENSELYYSAIAGMGLLGIIISASLKLQKLKHRILSKK
jgi:decaprenylphospho-beta-D-ribofuranose 2-oxidase